MHAKECQFKRVDERGCFAVPSITGLLGNLFFPSATSYATLSRSPATPISSTPTLPQTPAHYCQVRHAPSDGNIVGGAILSLEVDAHLACAVRVLY